METHAVRGAADGKGDMIVGALQTDNSASSDSNDFNFSFNPDSIMGGGIGGTTIGGGQSEYEGSGNDFIGSTITAGGEFSGVANDVSIIDSQIHANSGDLDIKGDLNVITTPDIWEGSGSSWNANVGTNGFGGGVGEITEDKNWTDTASGMWFEEGADIDVEGKTYLEGGAIVSEQEGGLLLSTGELEVADLAINDYADDSYVGGQVNVNIGNVVTGKGDVFTENTYGNVEYSSEGHDKQGNVNSTLSGLGELTIGGEKQDLAKLDELGINTDADNIITITKDESWEESFKIDLINVGVVAEQVDNLVNVVESFTAKVPDHIKADGKEGEDIWRKAIANGMSQDEATSFASTQEYSDLVNIRKQIEATRDETGRYDTEITYAVLKLEQSRMQGFYDTNCASAPSNIGACAQLAEALKAIGGAESLSLESLNQMISGFEAMLSSGSSSAEDAYLQQIYSLAKDCKDQWISHPQEMYKLHKDPEVNLAQELGSVGYNEKTIDSFMIPMFDIMAEYERGDISYEDAKDQLAYLQTNLGSAIDRLEELEFGEGWQAAGLSGRYLSEFNGIYNVLENMQNTDFSGALEAGEGSLDSFVGSQGYFMLSSENLTLGPTGQDAAIITSLVTLPVAGAHGLATLTETGALAGITGGGSLLGGGSGGAGTIITTGTGNQVLITGGGAVIVGGGTVAGMSGGDGSGGGSNDDDLRDVLEQAVDCAIDPSLAGCVPLPSGGKANDVPPRTLTSSDLGIEGKLTQLDGTYSVKSGVANVRVDMIEGNIKNPLSIIDSLVNTARKDGASSLSIEGTIANPRLYNVLEKRYGLVTKGSNDTIIIPID